MCLTIPGLRSRSTVGAPGSPAGTCAGRCGCRKWKNWCISSPPEPPGCPGTAPSCSLPPEHESHCGEVGCLQEQEWLFSTIRLNSTEQIMHITFYSCTCHFGNASHYCEMCNLPNNTFHTWILYIEGRGNLWLNVLNFSRSVKRVEILETGQELTYIHENSNANWWEIRFKQLVGITIHSNISWYNIL